MVAGAVLASLWRRRAHAADVEVPIPVQIELTARVAKYDRNAGKRMGPTCKVLIVRRDGDPTSRRAATVARSELAKLPLIAGVPLAVDELLYARADELAQRCAADGVALLMLTPGLSDVAPAIAAACVDLDLLTVSLLASDVAAGIVLGFALESSRPTIVVNLPQARRQNVDFSARLLAIAKVLE